MGNKSVNAIFVLTLLIGIVTFVINVIFTAGVLSDGERLRKAGRDTVIAPYWAWAMATLIGGVFAAAIYWLLHHSTFVNNDGGEKANEHEVSPEHHNS